MIGDFMNSLRLQLLLILVLFLIPLNSVFASSARIETIDGEVFTIKDFSMEGRQYFSVDHKGATTTLDWNDIASFEIRQVGSNFWVEVRLLDGKKEVFRIRQSFPFRGRSEFGKWSVPFERVKKVFLIGEVEEKRKEESLVKETSILPSYSSREVDKISLKNGDILLGNISHEIISIKTNYGTLSFKKDDILRVSFGSSGKAQKERESDALYSKYGDKLTGIISESQIKITLFNKTNLSIFREHIKEIEFGVMPEFGQKSSPERVIESQQNPITE
jgi:hypothetical protein